MTLSTSAGSTPALEKTVRESTVVLSQLMRPHHSNFGGKVHGGIILSLIDEAAYTCASRYAEAYCVTAGLDQVDFMSPVEVGDVVTLRAAVHHVGRTSMDIGINMEAENPRHPGTQRRTNACYVTMVAVGDDGTSIPVPRLRLETDEDRIANCEAQLRRRLRKEHRAAIAAGYCHISAIPPGAEAGLAAAPAERG